RRRPSPPPPPPSLRRGRDRPGPAPRGAGVAFGDVAGGGGLDGGKVLVDALEQAEQRLAFGVAQDREQRALAFEGHLEDLVVQGATLGRQRGDSHPAVSGV